MIGVIERIKNNVLLKCSNLNDDVIVKKLNDALDKSIYQFAEELMSLLSDVNINITEDIVRQKTRELLKTSITKKIKRKLFIDSLALQITNDMFIEDYAYKKINLDKLTKTYVKELEKNKKSNQLNMTEDLNLEEIIQKLLLYIEQEVTSKVRENKSLVKAVSFLVNKTKEELERFLEEMIKELDLKYLDILTTELKNNIEFETLDQNEIETNPKGEGEDIMTEEMITNIQLEPEKEALAETNKFSKYDDMTLFNKMILSLNTKEEKLTRDENKLADKKKEVEELLNETNKKIEANIERENALSQRKLDLNAREKDLNARLSEAEVIFLNMKPLIKGLNNIKATEMQGGNDNE